MSDEQQVMQGCHECVAILQQEFGAAPEDMDREQDVQYVLYHLLCQRLPALFRLGTFYEPDGTPFKGRRIYVEYETDNAYKGANGQNGRYDIALFGADQQLRADDPPLFAIELKLDWEPQEKFFLNDFTKLSDPRIKHPVFVYCDSDPCSVRYQGLFRALKARYPRVQIYYVCTDRLVTF